MSLTSPRSRRPRRLLRVLLAAVAVAVTAPAAAQAEMVALQFHPPTAPAPAPASLDPIAPGDPGWNRPTVGFPAPDISGNRIERAGDPAAATTDYVEYARTSPEGSDTFGPLRGSLLVDFATVDPALPAIMVPYGGMVAGPPCTGVRRASQTTWARIFTAKGYIVFLPDFTQPTNDTVTTWLGSMLIKSAAKGLPRSKGDCMADDGWEPGAKKAQVALQLAVRSLKSMLATFAAQHPTSPAAPAFANASRKVVAFGGSSGGHLAARLATRSADASGDPGDGPEHWRARRIAGAVAIGSIGECTAHNGVRTQDRIFGLPAFDPEMPRPFSGCGPITADAHTSPIKFFNGVYTFWAGIGNLGRWQVMPSPLSGSGGWGRQVGWDWVGDSRWPKATCDDLNAVRPGICTFQAFKVTDPQTHAEFPLFVGRPGARKGSPNYWDGGLADQVDEFFRSVKADDQVQ